MPNSMLLAGTTPNLLCKVWDVQDLGQHWLPQICDHTVGWAIRSGCTRCRLCIYMNLIAGTR